MLPAPSEVTEVQCLAKRHPNMECLEELGTQPTNQRLIDDLVYLLKRGVAIHAAPVNHLNTSLK